MNTFWNPKDKRKTRRQILSEFCVDAIKKQKYYEKIYRTKPNQMLIHNKDGAYVIVSKNYYYYHMKDDEYETETELVDEEEEREAQRIKDKYNYN
jgi:hypothetical protein